MLKWIESADGLNVRIISVASDLALAENRIITALQTRLSSLAIPFPPLAQRTEDIPVILQRLWATSPHPLPPIFDRAAWSQLLNHDWDGGVDELVAFADRASRLYGGRELERDQLRTMLGHQVARQLAQPDFNLKQHLAKEEKMFLIEALLKCNGVVQDAATLAGLNRTTFLAKMKRYGLARI
jgi:DNA-binding NtrC family response regulator